MAFIPSLLFTRNAIQQSLNTKGFDALMTLHGMVAHLLAVYGNRSGLLTE
jgi:hypothetical protein